MTPALLSRWASGLAVLVLAPAATLAQGEVRRLEPPRWRLELAATSTGVYARDEAGDSKVTGGLGASLGVEALWDAAEQTTAAVFARAGTAQVQVDGGSGYRTHPGTGVQLDVGAALERRVAGRIGVRGGLGLVWLHGPDAVVPFRFQNDAIHWAGEAGLTTTLSSRWPLSAALTYHTFRLGAASASDPVEAGWVSRVLLGVRYGR